MVVSDVIEFIYQNPPSSYSSSRTKNHKSRIKSHQQKCGISKFQRVFWWKNGLQSAIVKPYINRLEGQLARLAGERSLSVQGQLKGGAVRFMAGKPQTTTWGWC